jgi:hypothetical protein
VKHCLAFRCQTLTNPTLWQISLKCLLNLKLKWVNQADRAARGSGLPPPATRPGRRARHRAQPRRCPEGVPAEALVAGEAKAAAKGHGRALGRVSLTPMPLPRRGPFPGAWCCGAAFYLARQGPDGSRRGRKPRRGPRLAHQLSPLGLNPCPARDAMPSSYKKQRQSSQDAPRTIFD